MHHHTMDSRVCPELVHELRTIVGADHVCSDSEERRRRSRDLIPLEHECALVVYPGSAEEVAQVLQVAARYGLPVWPFSKGKNWGYGSTLANRDGALIMMLERMNRIHEVNESLGYAVIEPGVTQLQLYEYLRERHPSLWMDCTDSTPHGSVLGNALERGVGHTPYGDHFGQLCGLEVVLADGSVIETGGAPPGVHTRHTHKWGTGPFIDGLFSQSNLGIVTRGGIWLMRAPECFNLLVCEIDNPLSFSEFVEALREAALRGIIQNVHIWNAFLYSTAYMQYPYERRSSGECLSDAEIERIRGELKGAPWTMLCGIYGTKAEVRARRAYLRRHFGKFARLLFLNDTSVHFVEKLSAFRDSIKHRSLLRSTLDWCVRHTLYPGTFECFAAVPKVCGYAKGIPGEFIVSSAYFKRRAGRIEKNVDPVRDNCGLCWLAPIVPTTGEHVQRLYAIAKSICDKHKFELALAIIMLNPRTLIFAMPLFYDRDDAEETQRVQELYQELAAAAIAAGYPQYRTSVASMEQMLAETPALRSALGALKHALDPHNVIAPGRYGVRAQQL